MPPYNMKVGSLYHFHIHPGTRDFPQVLLCLKIFDKWHSETVGEFFDLEKEIIVQHELIDAFYDKRFVELKDEAP